MAIVLKDRVKETAAAPGTGSITLAGAVAGFQAFSAIGNGNVTYFAIVDPISGDWEVNYGTYTASGTTLSRNATPLSSSAAGALVNFTGAVDVFCTYPSEKAIYEEVSGNVLVDGGPITVIGSGVTSYNTFSAALGELYANINSFAQMYAQNYNDGSEASGDFVVYRNDAANDTSKFVDMGINSSNYSSTTYPIFSAGSAYTFNDGGEMFFGSATDDVIIFAGGVDVADEAARFDKTTKAMTTASDVNVGGDLNATGGTFTAAVTSSSTSVLTPANNEFVTKAYVDNATSTGIHIHDPVAAETSAALSAVYTQGGTTFNITDITGGNTVVTSTTHGLSIGDQIWLYSTAGNGLSINTPYFVYATPTTTSLQLTTSWAGPLLTGLTNASGLSYATRANSGVGAYLEASANQALPVAGVTTGDRVLVYQQATGYWDGVYTVTDLGSGSSKWKLTRATDANYYSPSDTTGLSEGDYFFVQSNSESYVLTTPGIVIIGYTTIIYTLFSSVPSYTGTSPIDVTGTTISLTTVPATLGGTGTATVTTGDMLYGSAADTWSKLPIGATYKPMVVDAAGIPSWNALALNQSGTVSGSLPATNGGTGLNAYTLGDTLYSSAANTLAKLAGNTTTTKKFLTQTGTGATSAAPVWDVVNGADVNGNISGSAGSVANALTAGSYLTSSGTFNGSVARTFAVDATSTNTASKVVARDASGNFSAGTITATLNGSATSATTATNIAGGVAGDLPYQSATGTTGFVADVATGNVLLSGGIGAAPAYGKVGLTTHVTGTLPIANGGTGTTSTTFVDLTANVTGTLPIANGGTGATTLAGASIATYAGTETLTNKRVTARIVAVADAATITPTGDTADQYEVTALAQAATIAAPSGTPTDGQKLILRIKDNGTARALTWTTTSGAYRAVGVTLPTTTVLSKVVYIGCIWNAQDSFWDVVAVAQLS